MPWAINLGLDLTTAVILVVVGVVAGTINTIAGGGSFLALPALVFAGLPAPVANGTNRIAVLLQSLVGSRAMYRRVPFDVRMTLLLALPTLLGAGLGAWLATLLEADAMRVAIGIALLCGAVILALRPQRFLTRRVDETPDPGRGRRIATTTALFVAGIYGGFLQAGVGVLLTLVLAGIARHDLLEATGMKNVIIACFTVPSLVIFALADAVAPAAGLVLAVGSMIGAQIGARLAVRGGRRLVLGAVVLALLLAGLRLLGVF